MGSHPEYVFIGAPLVVLTIVVFWLRARRNAGWRAAVAHVSQALGLQVLDARSGYARGKIGNSTIRLETTTQGRLIGSTDSYDVSFRELRVNTAWAPQPLCVHRRGSSTDHIAKPIPPQTPTGDAAFDAAFDVLGATPAQARALVEPPLRAMIEQLVGELGATLAHGNVHLRTRRWTAPPAALEATVRQMVALCDALEPLRT